MVAYKHKYTQFIINSSGQPAYYIKDDMGIFNLNSCFIKKNSFSKFVGILDEFKGLSDIINLCNLASLCYRLNFRYDTDECFNFVKKVVEIIRTDYPNITLTQANIENHGEVDVRPIQTLIKIDLDNNSIYANNVLMGALSTIGFVNNQLYDILDYTKDFSNILPIDIIKNLPLETESTLNQYNKIRSCIVGE